ncbi:MAG TPA: gamma-glutamylcyclotransferase, partial [Actinobacteria bacterium]|nr:gamma-glutamylcyclotransferase [Actinomycetota bacterium]
MTRPLFFAYTAHISPKRLAGLVPNAEFLFIAHLPETRMSFPIKDSVWNGGLPSVHAEEGNTVWGAVFSITRADLENLNEAEAREGRVPIETFKAVDREGHSHSIITHTCARAHNGGDHTPSRTYME